MTITITNLFSSPRVQVDDAAPTRVLEGSLDYVATALPKAGDRIERVRFLDKASPWSFSIVFVLPIAPL